MGNIANLEFIKKLLKTQSGYSISKNTGISQSAIARYQKGDADLNNMRLGDAIKLTNYFMNNQSLRPD